jgi:hypothetical protein
MIHYILQHIEGLQTADLAHLPTDDDTEQQQADYGTRFRYPVWSGLLLLVREEAG